MPAKYCRRQRIKPTSINIKLHSINYHIIIKISTFICSNSIFTIYFTTFNIRHEDRDPCWTIWSVTLVFALGKKGLFQLLKGGVGSYYLNKKKLIDIYS